MLLLDNKEFLLDDFKNEADFETSAIKVQDRVFGKNRAYLDIKKKIGKKGQTRNIPDDYLLDLSSAKEPKLFVVENELARHQPLKHIAVQILEFSISFETNPTHLKDTIKTAIQNDKSAIAHIAEIADISPWKDTGKYIVKFTKPAKKLKKPIKLVPNGVVNAPQTPRYTSIESINKAKNLDEAFLWKKAKIE